MNVLVLSTLILVGLLSIFFELFSIASFLPLMQQAFGGDSIFANESLSKISDVLIQYFHNFNYLFIFIIYKMVVKNLVLIRQNYYTITVCKKI